MLYTFDEVLYFYFLVVSCAYSACSDLQVLIVRYWMSQGTLEDIAKFEMKLAAVLPPSKGLDHGDVSEVIRQENEQSNQVNMDSMYILVLVIQIIFGSVF